MTTYDLQYDAENRMVHVSGGVTAAEFVYNVDGNRVQAIEESTTTNYIGNCFEWKGSTSTM